MKKPPYVFCTHILFASAIILIFGSLFLHSISKPLKFNPNWLRATTTYFARKKFRSRRDNPNSIKLSCKSIKKPLKVHTKNRTFLFCKISKDRIFHILSSRVKSSDQVIFDSDGSSVIVDKSANDHICSEEDMFTDNI